MAEIDIDSMLRSAALATSYPATPDMRAGVGRRLRGGALTRGRSAPLAARALSQRAREPRRTLIPRMAMVAILIAVVALGTALIVEPGREAIARFFGVQGSRIEVLPSEAFPTPLPTRAPSLGGPATSKPLSELVARGVAEAMSLGALAQDAAFAPGLPSGYGPPRQAYVVRFGEDRVIALEYDSFELWEAQIEGDATFGKIVPPGGLLQDTAVRGLPAVWLSGAPHYVSYEDRAGRYIESSSRLVEKSTLIWRTGYAFYRIETDLTLEETRRIAETLP